MKTNIIFNNANAFTNFLFNLKHLNIKDTYTLSTTKYPEIKEAIEWIIDLIKYKYREYPTERIKIDLVGDYDEIQKLLDSN